MSDTGDLDDWASDEFGAAQLGDARLTQRLIALASPLSQAPQCSFPQSLDGAELKAGYRFFDNPKVDTDGVLSPHIGQTLGRMGQVPVVLAVQDTTEFNLSHLPATEGLGYGTGHNLRGFMMHSMLAVTPEGLPLGVLGMKTWTRAPDDFGKGKLRKQRTIRDKESVKWLEGLEHLSALKARCPDTHIVGVCDREGDVYDVFVAERPAGVDWLVRAGWNRSVAHPEKYLWEAIAAAPELGQTELQIPGSGNTIARTARLTLRCAPVRLRPPRYRRRKGLPDIKVFVIHALEAEVPEGLEPLEWMLLTSVPTSTREQALERLAWYRASRSRLMCRACRYQGTVTSGTIFDKTRTPLKVWLAAAWYVTNQKHGVSALGLQRVLGLGSYQTAWTMLHRFRRAMVRPGRESLKGTVEVDETFIAITDRKRPVAKVGRQNNTTKTLVAIAVETLEPKGFGRIRLRRIPDNTEQYLLPFVTETVEPGATVHTDGLSAYLALPKYGYLHKRTVMLGSEIPAHISMPGVHRVASLIKRWLLGTHHGAVQPEQLDAYLDEFAFRFNRRTSNSRGLLFYRLLEQAVMTVLSQ